MSEPIFDPQYWKTRLHDATTLGQPHHAVFCCGEAHWKRIEERHVDILQKHVGAFDYVLDAGCGYGRLIDMLPKGWIGNYLGVDMSPHMVERAARRYPSRKFAVADLRDLKDLGDDWFDIAVLISVRPMVIRNAGQVEWDKMERELRRVSRRLLYLEYDEHDNGSLE